MSNRRTVSIEEEAEPLRSGDMITVIHAGGRSAQVKFDWIYGDKVNRCYVRWGLAGEYEVTFPTGQLLGGKPRKKASLWRVCESDMRRIEATRKAIQQERYERKKRERH